MDQSRIELWQGKVLFLTHTCYLDTSNGASVASRAMMECLSRHGFSVGVVSGTVFESSEVIDPVEWLSEQGIHTDSVLTDVASPENEGASVPGFSWFRVRGVPVMLHQSPITSPHVPDAAETASFLELSGKAIELFRPQVVVNYGGDALALGIRRQAKLAGAAVVFPLHNFSYRVSAPFEDSDAVIVPSRFAASYYRRSLGLNCEVLPNLIDIKRATACSQDRKYLTFVTPSYEKGVYIFSRIADELGRWRPDIPLLVVEGRGTERTLVDCGLDLRAHGNVFVMSNTSDPREFWGVTRICLMPSLWWENQPLVAIEAMINGIPVIGSDRGGIPETLGDSGIILGLPNRLNPLSRELPTAEEVEAWIRTVITLWDDKDWYAELSRRTFIESNRWLPEILEPQYVSFFQRMRDLVKVRSRSI